MNFLQHSTSIPIASLEYAKANSEIFDTHAIATAKPIQQSHIAGLFAEYRYLNNGWGARYDMDSSQNLPIVYWNDCELAPKLCAPENCVNGQPRFVQQLAGYSVADVLRSDGTVDQTKLTQIVTEFCE